jgi:stage IV sporulation protein FB
MFEDLRRFVLINIILACISALLIHEGFHILAARVLGVALYAFRPSLVGINARLRNTPGLRKQIAVYIAGSLGNFLIAAFLFNSEGFFRNLSESNLAIGLFNLLPMYPLDGAQIFIIISYKLVGGNKTFRVIKKLSKIVKAGLFATGLLQLVLYYNPSLLILVLFIPGGRLLEETVSIMNLEYLLNRKRRIKKKKIYPVKEFAAMGNCTLSEVMQKLDYDCFHIIYILNDDMKIIGRITEQDIINAAQIHSSEKKIYEVFKLSDNIMYL